MIDVFKTEIIEAEKSRTDLLKWKLIIVAALGAFGLGIRPEVSPSTSTALSPILALSLIPLAATYVDLLCKHLQFRILVISVFFQSVKTKDEILRFFISYEEFCEKVRSAFNFEDWAQVGSTVALSVLVPLVAVYRLGLCEEELWVIFASGGIGLLFSLLIHLSFVNKVNFIKQKRKGTDKIAVQRWQKLNEYVSETIGMIIVHNDKLLDVIRNSYTKDSLQNLVSLLEERGTFDFRPLSTHLFPAAEVNNETQYTGYKHIWIRDNIHVAHAHFVVGQFDVAKNVAISLMEYFKKNQRRFEDIIRDPDRANTVMDRPHVRFDGTTLMEIDEKWSHAQNDALGYFLWFYCQLIKNAQITPEAEDCRLLALFPLYFQAIKYWNDADSGHWEEERKIEASSIGAVKAGLDALLEITLTFPEIKNLLVYNNHIVSSGLIATLAEHGQSALRDILPWECVKPPARQRRYDAAMLFLVYPLGVVNEEMSDQIICDVTQHLQGDHGIRRYVGDSFWAPDYKSKLPPEKRTIDVSDDMSSRNRLVGEGQEAQWCIFDSILSVIFGLKFGRTGDEDHLQKQTWYLNRALGQLTGPDCVAGEFRCPELYYLEMGKYTPNDSTPLLWAQANLMLALNEMKISLDRNLKT